MTCHKSKYYLGMGSACCFVQYLFRLVYHQRYSVPILNFSSVHFVNVGLGSTVCLHVQTRNSVRVRVRALCYFIIFSIPKSKSMFSPFLVTSNWIRSRT